MEDVAEAEAAEGVLDDDDIDDGAEGGLAGRLVGLSGLRDIGVTVGLTLVFGLVGIIEGGAAALDFGTGNLAPPATLKGGMPCRTSFG